MYWNSQSYNTPGSSRMISNENKENINMLSPGPKMDVDTYMYEDDISIAESPMRITGICRQSSDDHDHNSLDSGYSAGKFSSPKSKGFSFNSFTSMEEDILDISELESEEVNENLPGDFNKLISAPLNNKEGKESPEFAFARPPFRRALSMITDTNCPNNSRVRACLFKDKEEIDVKNFKRPEPPVEQISPLSIKRSRIFVGDQPIRKIDARPVFQRSISAREDTIKSALNRSSAQPDLIGDFTKAFCLPLIPGRHQDLKSITPSTLAELMRGEYTATVASFKVIDCRYPYEFEGGHIIGAQNVYTKQQIHEEFINIKEKNLQPDICENNKRHILVFHCEFSSERGPNLSRFLRSMDRTHNKDFYPYLHYPEVYLLDGGYKNFFEKYSELCAPSEYLPMLHPDHEQNLKHFRAKSKTWNSDVKSSKSQYRTSSFKRL